MITMDECKDALDWKKAFKKFLPNQEQSDKKLSCSLKSAQEQESQEKKKLSTCISFSETSTNFKDISEDSGNQSHKLTLNKRPTSIIHRVHHVKNSRELSSNITKSDKNNVVPEWNKAFKSILREHSAAPAFGNQKTQEHLQTCDTSVNARSTPKKKFYKVPKLLKQENLQTCDTSVNTRSTPKKKFHKVPKPWDPEEEKVKEIFALSRMFIRNHYNLNDCEGAGVDVFKYGYSISKSFGRPSNVEFIDETPQKCESRTKPFVPLKGFVAKYQPYTTAELIASPDVPFNEPPWDNDFLF